MPANVEIKARLPSEQVESVIEKACQLGQSEVETLEQTDTFYNCVRPGTRLKLREEVRNQKTMKAQLIAYSRPDQLGPKFSNYSISRFEQPEADQLKIVLEQSLGIHGQVIKVRKLVMIGQTRVHIDRVKYLGDFMELEVCLREDQTADDGQRVAEEILKQLEIPLSNLVAPAYMDLLLAKAA